MSINFRTIFYFFLLFTFFSGNRNISNFVLCLESDGHTTVEYSHTKHTCQPSVHTNMSLSSARKNTLANFDEQTCLDIPISINNMNGSMLSSENSGVLSNAPIILTSLDSYYKVVKHSKSKDLLQPLQSIKPTNFLLNTTILLI